MRLLLIMALVCLPCSAQVLSYYGFTTLNPNIYATATSNDGVNWTNNGGVWPGQQVNAPDAIYYHGKIYLLLAAATDANHLLTQQLIGIVQPDKTVTTIIVWDWSSQVNAASVFAGRWFVDSSNVVHIFVPIAPTTANTTYSVYESHALNSDLTWWSPPQLITITGTINASNYDPRVIQVGNTFFMYTSTFIGVGADGLCISTASSLLGPYTAASCSNTSGSNLFPLNGIKYEGPGSFHVDSATNSQFMAEHIGPYAMEGTTCTGSNLATCTLGTMSAWVSPGFSYRNGSVIRTPGQPQGAIAAVSAN